MARGDASFRLEVKSRGLVLGAVVAGTLALMGLVVLSDREGFTWLRYGFVLVPALLAIWFGLSGRVDIRRLGAICVLFVAAMLFWAIFEQAGVTLSLFGDQLSRQRDLRLCVSIGVVPVAQFVVRHSADAVLCVVLDADGYSRSHRVR